MEKFIDGVSPRVHKKMQEAYEEQTHCETHWNGEEDESDFEVLHKGMSHAVHLGKQTCSCRVWDLTRVSCAHAISAILFKRRKPKYYISNWYKLENYVVAYNRMINPLQCSMYWDKEGEGMKLPPNIVRRKLGRPKTARRKGPFEGQKNPFKASRLGCPQKCGHCGSTDHPKRHCPTPAPPPARSNSEQASQSQVNEEGTSERRKRGRPKGSKSRISKNAVNMARCQGPTPVEILRQKRSMGRGVTQSQDATNVNTGSTTRGGGVSRRGNGRGRRRITRVNMPEGYGL